MKTNHYQKFVALSIAAYALALSWLIYSFLNGWMDRGLLFNADALYLPSIFKNLFHEGKFFSDWVLAPSSNLFPDAILYALAYLSSEQPVIQLLVFAILQSLSFFTVSSLLLSCFLRVNLAVSYAAITSASIITLGLHFPDPHGLSFISVFHFGSLIAYTLLCALLLKYLATTTTSNKRILGVLVFIVATLAAISDHLIALHFMAPVLLIGITMFFKQADGKVVLSFAAILLLGALLASILEKLLIPNLGRLDYSIGFGSITHKMALLANWATSKPPITQLALLAFPVSLIVAITFIVRNRHATDSRVARQIVFAYFILVSTSLTLLATGFSNRDFTIRYLLPFIFLPPIFLFSLLQDRTSHIFAVLIFVISLSAIISTPARKAESIKVYYELARCVDTLTQKHHVSRGIAQYWDAIPVYVFSESRLSVVPVLSDASPSRWMFNTRDYSGQFSFAILDSADSNFNHIFRNTLKKRLAREPIEYQCQGNTLLVFHDETISLPQQSVVSNRRSSILESFINNPRALLIMAREESEKGNHEASARLFSEAIALLRRSGAREETIQSYISESEQSNRKPD